MQNVKQLSPSTDLDLVFLHGWGMNSAIFNDFIRSLQAHLMAEDYSGITVRALDLPGYGELASMNNATDENAENDRVKRSQAKLINDALCIESQLKSNTILIGWSLGGLLAQQIALMQSYKVKGLICLCSSPKFASDHNWNGIELDVLLSFQQQLVNDPVRTLKRFLAIQNLGQSRAKANIQMMLNSLASKTMASAETLKNGLGLLENIDLRDQIANINVPTLRIYGRLDSLIPYASSAQIADLQPLAKHIVYEKASHAPFISHPQNLIADILDFLKNAKKD